MEESQEECVICRDPFKGDITQYDKSSVFGCRCRIFFHEECWNEFNQGEIKCPFCRVSSIIVAVRMPEIVIVAPEEENEEENEDDIRNSFTVMSSMFATLYLLVICIFYGISGFSVLARGNLTIQDVDTLSVSLFGFVYFLNSYGVCLWCLFKRYKFSTLMNYVIIPGCVFFVYVNFIFYMGNLSEMAKIATLIWIYVVYFILVSLILVFIVNVCYDCSRD